MSGWIKFDKDMADDPRLLEAASKLGKRYVIAVRSAAGGSDLSESDHLAFACNAVTGALVTLWKYADVHIRDDDTLPVTRATLDAMVKIVGFFEVMPREWIDELDDGTVVLPGYCKKNSLIAKRKAAVKSNARVTAFRARKKVRGNAHETHSSTRYTPVSKVVDQDQDQDQDQDHKNKNCSAAKRTPTDIPRGTDAEWFLDFKLAMPERAGDHNWRGAQRAGNARIAEGHQPSEFIDGAKRYTEFCRLTGKLGTEYVKQASTFLGPGKPFLERWDPPATKADTRLRGNLTAAEEFMRRTEQKH
jgi:hypothetical protein